MRILYFPVYTKNKMRQDLNGCSSHRLMMSLKCKISKFVLVFDQNHISCPHYYTVELFSCLQGSCRTCRLTLLFSYHLPSEAIISWYV